MHLVQKHIAQGSHCCYVSCSLTAPQAATDPECLQTGTLLSKLAECIGDTDKAVRAALKELLSHVILPQLKGDMLGPFVPLIMAHLFSALTSSSEPVRSAPLCNTFCSIIGKKCLPHAKHHAPLKLVSTAGVCGTPFDCFQQACMYRKTQKQAVMCGTNHDMHISISMAECAIWYWKCKPYPLLLCHLPLLSAFNFKASAKPSGPLPCYIPDWHRPFISKTCKCNNAAHLGLIWTAKTFPAHIELSMINCNVIIVIIISIITVSVIIIHGMIVVIVSCVIGRAPWISWKSSWMQLPSRLCTATWTELCSTLWSCCPLPDAPALSLLTPHHLCSRFVDMGCPAVLSSLPPTLC